jgi:hypothetical protein
LIPEFKNYKVDKGDTVSRMSLHFLLQTQQYLMHENQLKRNQLRYNIQIKMDFINPESGEICRKKAGMKKNKCTTTLFILTKSKKIINRSINSEKKNPITAWTPQKVWTNL